jgi:hypothetical protein
LVAFDLRRGVDLLNLPDRHMRVDLYSVTADILLFENHECGQGRLNFQFEDVLATQRRNEGTMTTDGIEDKQQLHTMVELLAPEQVHALRGLVEVMLDPLSRKLAMAPIEDEEISEEEERAVAEAREWLKHNKPISHEEVLSEFGLSMDDFCKMSEVPLPPKSGGNG